MNLNRNYLCLVMSTFLVECPTSPIATATTKMTSKTNRVCTYEECQTS